MPALCGALGRLLVGVVLLSALALVVPRVLGLEVYGVVSGSMEPALPVGSAVAVRPVGLDEVGVGSVVAFSRGGSVVTHRVVEVREDGRLATQGDANDVPDLLPVGAYELVGEVVAHVPAAGRVLMAYSTWGGKLSLLAVGLAGVMFCWVGERLAAGREERGADSARRGGSGGSVLRKALALVATLVFVGSGGYAAYLWGRLAVGRASYADASVAYTHAAIVAGDEARPPKEVDFAALRAVNPDVVGWIICPGTVIDYPVLKGPDNDYYLHRLYDGSWVYVGSVFVDAACWDGFADANTIVYGHHMTDGSMFGCLHEWHDQAFYDEHTYMWLLTPGGDYRVDLLAGHTVDADAPVYTIYHEMGDDLLAYLGEAVAASDFAADVSLDGDARYVLLSTCYGDAYEGARYVLHGKLVPVE